MNANIPTISTRCYCVNVWLSFLCSHLCPYLTGCFKSWYYDPAGFWCVVFISMIYMIYVNILSCSLFGALCYICRKVKLPSGCIHNEVKGQWSQWAVLLLLIWITLRLPVWNPINSGLKERKDHLESTFYQGKVWNMGKMFRKNGGQIVPVL